MAAMNIAYKEYLTMESTTLSGWQATSCRLFDGTDITSGHEYLILAYGIIRNTDPSQKIGVRLAHSFNEILGTTDIYSPPDSAHSKSFFLMTKWVANGDDIQIQFQEISTGTAELDEQVLIAIDLDDLSSTDWYYDEVLATQALSTTWSTSNNASVTFTPSQVGDWLIITSAETETENISKDVIDHMCRMLRSGEANDTIPNTRREVEQADEHQHPTLARVFSLGAVSNTFTQQSATDTTPNPLDQRLSSRVFALRLGAFADVTWSWTVGSIELNDVNYNTEIGSISHTPSVASQKAIIIAQAEYVPFSASRYMHGRVRIDETSNLPGPPGVTGGPAYVRSFNVDDVLDVANLGGIDLTAASHSIDWDAATPSVASGTYVKYRTMIAISPELAAGEGIVKVQNETVRC